MTVSLTFLWFVGLFQVADRSISDISGYDLSAVNEIKYVRH